MLEGDKLLSADLSKLLTKPHFADVVFELETQQIRAHRVILACRSEWFYNLFLSDAEQTWEDNCLVVKVADMKLPAF